MKVQQVLKNLSIKTKGNWDLSLKETKDLLDPINTLYFYCWKKFRGYPPVSKSSEKDLWNEYPRKKSY